MNWENCDFWSESNEEIKTDYSETASHTKLIQDENEQKKILQLHKWQDPRKNEYRKTFIDLASTFGELIVNSNTADEGIRGLMTEDCEAFLFNFLEIDPVRYTAKPDEFFDLFKGYKVIKRQVKEAYADVDSKAAFQTCYYELLDLEDNSVLSQFSMEAFSFRDGKISKYRASFGFSNSFDEFNHPFHLSLKEKMLAKVKQLHYAWAGQPDLERIASLFIPCTEYKIWSWEDQKAFTFCKSDFVSGFKGIEDRYMINSVVPYNVYSEGRFVMGNYVFHLEGKHEFAGQKFIWLSTCIYTFNKDLNIVKVNQQGELYPEDEIEIPYEGFWREKMIQKFKEVYARKQTKEGEWFLLDTTDFLFSIEMSRFQPKHTSEIDWIQGYKEFDKLLRVVKEKNQDFEWGKPVDIYVDLYDPSYDILIIVECLKGKIIRDNYKYPGVEMNFYSIKKFCVENGKVAKATMFVSEIPEPIPSPFDDHTFTAQNIIRKSCKENL